MSFSGSADEAVAHLKATKPLGSWSVETKGGAVRLLRRKISTTDTYFLDIHYDKSSKCVVGILSKPKKGKAQGQVIVDKAGSPVSISKVKIIVCSNYDPNMKKSSTTSSSTATSATARSSATTSEPASILPTLSDEDNKKLLQYAFYAIVAATILKMVSQAMMTLSLTCRKPDVMVIVNGDGGGSDWIALLKTMWVETKRQGLEDSQRWV